MLHNLFFFSPQNAMYLTVLSLLGHKIFTFFIKCELTVKCPVMGPKGLKHIFKYVFSRTKEWTDVQHMNKTKTFQYSTCVRNSGSSSLRSLHWISPALFMARVCLCQSFRLYESNLLFTLFSSSFSVCSLASCKSAQSNTPTGHINTTVLNSN